jgi:soluble lytic murein transglycosylase-like protein
VEPQESTVYIPRAGKARTRLPPVEILYPGADGRLRHASFSQAFVVGRGRDCAVQVPNPIVSRRHAEIFPEGDRWWVRDLGSSNGTLVAGRPVDRLPLSGTVTLELGREGPQVRVTAPPPPPPSPPPAGKPPASLEEVSDHYFKGEKAGPAGEHTMLIRRAFKDVKRRQSRLYLILASVAFLLLAAVGGVAVFQHLQLQRMSGLANDIFYGMKELELYVANLEADLEAELEQTARARRREEIGEARRKLAAMRENYEAYVREFRASQLVVPDSEELLILHMARVFGETELDVPEGFADEVRAYIKRWQSSPRLERAIRRLHDNNFGPAIYRALASQDLPPQFMYVALQETNFQPRAVGPPTRYGRAKGMWQFIPSTGKRYGLSPGPLQHSGAYDPADERHDFRKATMAAARYLKDIYRTDAQASGLLVIASYNWGEGNIIKRIRQMPENPRERNFWELLRRYKIPKETYDYVFYIFSAAVICENPRLFGFDFDNPLSGLQGVDRV